MHIWRGGAGCILPDMKRTARVNLQGIAGSLGKLSPSSAYVACNETTDLLFWLQRMGGGVTRPAK